MTFTDMLREENNDIFQEIFNHPFITGIGAGNVPKEAVTHYVKADVEYLNAFMKIYGIAMSKANTREDILFFKDQIDLALDEEEPHQNFCDYAGVGYNDLQGHPLPPNADHYVKHMMYHANTGSLGETLCALAACPWTYVEIAREVIKTYQPTEDHPFYKWIHFYADSEEDTKKMLERINSLARDASSQEKTKMKEAFRKSCQHELGFWEMSYTGQTWDLKSEVHFK